MKILLNLRNCWHRKNRGNSLYGRLGVRDERAILLLTYKYLKTDGRVRQNRGFSQPYFVTATRVKKKVSSPRGMSRCVSLLKPFECGSRISRKLRYLPGIFNAKFKQKTVLDPSTGLSENTLSQPLNKF